MLVIVIVVVVPTGYPTPGPGDYDLQGVHSVGRDTRKPSIHTLLNPLKG